MGRVASKPPVLRRKWVVDEVYIVSLPLIWTNPFDCILICLWAIKGFYDSFFGRFFFYMDVVLLIETAIVYFIQIRRRPDHFHYSDWALSIGILFATPSSKN